MPNYRKRNNNANRNKNKNKNKIQSNTTTSSSSSSVKQEHSVVETFAVIEAGTEPNQPADVSQNLCTTSAKSSVFEKNIVVVCVNRSSSPSSNEEIDENACSVDTDTNMCDSAGETQTVQRQSNYSSTFNCSSSSSSSSKKSTEIERRHRSESSALDGDSTLGNSVITDTFVEVSSGKNSVKTGSANTKDATVPVAEKTVTESTRIDDINFRENKSRFDDRRDVSKERSGSRESATEVNENEAHKVIVHSVHVQNNSTEQEVITQQTPPAHKTTRVIVHQVSREYPSSPSKVIVQQAEESRSSSHAAFKRDVDLSTKLLTKTAGSSTTPTLSFSNVQGQPSREFVHQIFSANDPFHHTSPANATVSPFSNVQGHPGRVIVQHVSKESDHVSQEKGTKVIVHQISKEGHEASTSTNVIVHPKEETIRSSKGSVIVHQISKEKQAGSSASPVITRHNVPQKTENNVFIHQISSSNDANTKESSTVLTQGSDQFSSPQQSKAKTTQQPKKVIIIPIVQENSTQTSPLPSFNESSLHSNLLEIIKDDQNQVNTSTNGREISRQTSSSPLSRSQAICFTNHSESLEEKARLTSVPTDEVNITPLKEIVHPILQEGGTQTTPIDESSPQTKRFASSTSPERRERLEPLVIPSFPVTRHSKTIIRPIPHPELSQTAFPLSTKSLEEIDQSSGKIAHTILKDVASELRSSFFIKKSRSKVAQEPAVTSFPTSVKNQNSLRPGFFENKTHQIETNPVDAESKVIFHQISREKSKSPSPFNDHQSMSSGNTSESQKKETRTEASSISSSKVIVHQISRDEQSATSSTPNDKKEKSISSKAKTSQSVEVPAPKTEPNEPFVIVHQISREEQNTTSSTSKNIKGQSISTNTKTTESLEDSTIPLKTDLDEPKVIVHQIFPSSSGSFPLPVTSSTDSKKSNAGRPSIPPKPSSSFPISKEIIDHPAQYNSSSTVLEQKKINFKTLKEESKLRQSCVTLTSPFSFPTPDDSQSKQTKSNFPLSSEPLNSHTSNSKPKEIRHQISLEKPKTAGFPTTSQISSKHHSSTLESKEIKHKVLKEESSSDLQQHAHHQQTSKSSFSESSFPMSKEKQNHPIQYNSNPHDRHSKSIDLQNLRDSSKLTQSTSPYNPSSSEPKEVIHHIHQEGDTTNDHKAKDIPTDRQVYDQQTSQDESISSSEGSVLTAIQAESPRSISPPVVDDQEKNVSSEDSQSSAPGQKEEAADKKKLSLVTDINRAVRSEKVIYHPIVRQIGIEKPLGYRVESPQPDSKPTIVKKSKSFDDDDVVIQEMSDASSTGDTDNPPLISEADSETDTLEAIDAYPETSTRSLLLSVQTLPPDHEDDNTSSPKSSHDYKHRRQQNRAALESHFLPQFLAPNFLDSIKEENSDLSDSERRSTCSDRTDHSIHNCDLEDDVFLDPPKKANAVFPKSNLDFSKKHKNVRSPKTSVIREEASPPTVVEAKIIDQSSVEESCSSWATDLTPLSEAAEVVYIDSASSSVSDLLELDYSQGQPEDSIDVRIQTPTIDLESVNDMFAACQQIESNDRVKTTTPSQTLPPVKEQENLSEQNLLPPHNNNDDRAHTSTATTTEERKILDEIISEKIETMSETVDTHANDHVVDGESSSSGRYENSNENNSTSCGSAINQVVTPSVVGLSKNMDNIREIVSASGSGSESKQKKSDTAAGLASSENSSPFTIRSGNRSGDETESSPIRKLRSLCTEALASMPYGEEVLQELATVAQNIREMPYPLPDLPQIRDIQLSLGQQPEKSSVIKLSQVPPRPVPGGQKFNSPPPPPVPEPPTTYDSWLGVPTKSDPSVLVCLSPSQRNAVKNDSTADSLLDMHKKFVERRGYHEYTTKQVNAMNQANSQGTQKLNKIDSPPPPPLPPRPSPIETSKSNGNTQAATDSNDDDQNNHRLLAIIRDTHESQQQHQLKSSMTSTSENISRKTENGTTNTNGGGGGHEKDFANSSSVSKQTQERFVSESNKSHSAHSEMQNNQTERTIKVDRESPVMGIRFPTSEYFDSIFDGKNKRFSNIETGSPAGFCSQILATQPKRYSNIETSSFESRKRVENGKVLYDVSDSKREKIREGDQPDSAAAFTSFPDLSKIKTIGLSSFPYVASPKSSDSRPQTAGDSENIMSAFKLNSQPTAPPVAVNRLESSPPAPPVPPLPQTAADTTATTKTATTKSTTSTSESFINRNLNHEMREKFFDEFRQPAKEAAADTNQKHTKTSATATTKKSSEIAFQHEKLFKDFDELSNLLNNELESGKRRPPATLDGADIPSSVSDYHRVARESRIQSNDVSSTTHTETHRREQMKKLAEEIDRTTKQRREKRIPINIERKNSNPGPSSAPVLTQPRSYDIPVRVENGSGVQRPQRPSLQHQRSYEIPIRMESQSSGRQRTTSEHQSRHEIPIQVERPEKPERFRRAESMFNISDTTSSRHLGHDDWLKYVDDIGSSENVCKPFQREVEICFLGRRPNIRAPRMSASTNDLSNIHTFDTHGAYDVRRTTTTQTPRPQQPPRRSYHSSQSLIDTTPITPCVSSRRSPAPERRSSLPRELHDKQLQYITSKEQQLKYEFERLENERRQLIDEMNRTQLNQRISREAYRQRQLPPLTEDETFRQQMAEEWLDKVAEREERRLHKIIKISKINQETGSAPVAPPRRVSVDDIGDEFLRRVKERRSKLCMPSDSDWESGAESQPQPRTDGSRSETDDPPATVFEGQSAANINQLPKHLREFAKLTSQLQEEHREETTHNSSSSATKRSSMVTTVKTSNNSHHESQQTMQQDAARVRDLEQLSQQGKRQKLVTILRHKKTADSSGASGGGGSSCQPTTAAGAANSANSAIKRRKQTRFLLTPNRRSWSESDLLREIDKELVLARGFLFANGVWTPKNQTPTSSRTSLNDFQPRNTTPSFPTAPKDQKPTENRSSSACGRTTSQKGVPPPPPLPLWTPQPERKQFRPVHFESPTLQRRYVRQQSSSSEAPSPPWSYTKSEPFPGYQSQSCTNLFSQKDTAISWPPQQVASPSDKEVPTTTTTIVNDPVVVEADDNNNEGFAPTTSIAEKIKSFERSNSNYELRRPFVRHNPNEKPAILRPNEVIFSVKNEYMSEPETEYDKPKKMAQLSRRQYDGIGPTTRDGMPVVLRSEVKEPNQHEWYKRIFQTIHKQKNPDDYVTIRYKCPRGRYPYKSNGYMSEPEPPNYDSDYSTVKYRTLERRRLQSTGTGTESRTSARTGNESQDETFYGTMPNPVKSGQGSYKVQPGRIENYITGHSSVSEKERKEWWDEVMDIFNGQLDQQKLSPHYTEGNLSRALLKEQGYTSDSNLVFRKKDVPLLQSPLSPVEQKQVYKSVQAGGQPPLFGFRKPAPEKPKETEFEYVPITPTLTKIRVHSKEVMPKNHQTASDRELICYPITNLSRPVDMFAPFPKHVPSFIPLNQAPLPPNRKSSRIRTTSMALKISSSPVRRPTSANSSRHEACFQTKDAISPPPPKPTKYGTITLRKTVKRTEPLSLLRSKSAGAVVGILSAAKEEKSSRDGRVSRKQQSVRLSSCSPVRSASRLTTFRATSRSPVAFGRSVSKERSFAEEKKRIEESLPSVKTDFTASTNILRDPRLRSPDQVKRAVRSYAFPIERSKSAPKVLPALKSSYTSTYVIRRMPSPLRKDISNTKKGPSSARSLTKSPAVARSKSQTNKLSDKLSSKSLTKTSSTVSLARTSSTFSVDSIAAKPKATQKKPLTITRYSSKTETEKSKSKPITIAPSKSDSNVLKKIKESPELKKKIIKAIPSQQKIVRTNHFFQNLLMRDTSPKRVVEPVSVHDKTRYWNTMLLPSKKSISETRHTAYRSLSPPVRPHFVEEYESVQHFQSDDEGSEFGDRSGRTEDLVWQYEQRSRSEPRPVRAIRTVCDIARPESPARSYVREFSPTREIRVPQTREVRSPSRRRIQNFRDSQRGETGKVIRASSLSSADDRFQRSLYHCDDISRSANSLDYIERHSPSCRYNNSERFIDLNRFYSTLERVGQLERATSASSLKPIRREGEPLDFEEWRKIRFHERAERELSYLVGKLKEDQKQKDFLFRPKDVEDVKWIGNRDLSLKSKDKSVEDLRENFEKKIHQEWLDESKRLELESKKDTYKPYWRGSSVVDLASNMEIKYNPDSGSFGVQKTKSEVTPQEKPLCLSKRLISTLSKDQVSKITQQLNEIYNASEPKAKPDVTEEYVITVDKQTPTNALKVRCNSSISKEELIGPVLRRKEASEKNAQSKKIDRLTREFQTEITESEKRRLSNDFSREIQGKARSSSPIILGRETRGASAAENAKKSLPHVPPPPPLPKDLIEIKKPAPPKPKRKVVEEQRQMEEEFPEERVVIEDLSSTEIELKPEETVSKKIQYFEERKFEEPPKTIYHAREDSSPDEDELMRVIEANIKARAQSEKFHHQELSSSVTDLKDLFGEKESSRINFPLPRLPPPPDETIYHETKQDQNRSTSLTLCASHDGNVENVDTMYRSRSTSPQSKETSYLHRVNTGEVRKIKDKFESLGRPKKKNHFFAISPLRKVRSDPELSNDGSKDTLKTIVRDHELGDVSWIAHKFEVRNTGTSARGRSRIRKPGSPIQRMPLRKEDRLMPHIDIISKTASLKQEMMKSRSPSPARQQPTLHTGGVERIRCIFETSPDRTSPVAQPRLGTSSPELRDISNHLTASWIAHKYPKPLDNDLRSPPPVQHEKLVKSDSLPYRETKRQERPFRSRSISPPKVAKQKPPTTSILKPRFDFFANQKFDPLMHRPKARYVPDAGDDNSKKTIQSGTRKTTAVKFKDDDEAPTPPLPPAKGVPLPLDLYGSNNLESPNRYFESDVNIHYKTPIRYEYKDPIPEEELAIRQAEQMQKLYQEERRRKYLQELQDMNSRRHTDNFTSSQKSPIPLNRYDDFHSDLAPKSPNSSNYPRTVARALYNFQGQTARELTFKKGDVIYIRRQIDKNWYEGEHNAMIGLLPSNYVELLTKDGIRQPPKKPSEGQARAKYNFQAQSGIELSLNKGEHVILTRRVDDNWFEGKIANRKGIFPVSYVEVLVDIGADDKAGRIPASKSIITQSSSSMRPSLDTLRTNINNEFNSLTSNGQQPPNGILRETRTLHKTEVLHVDTNTEPVAYRALYKYRPQNTDELELQEGDIVFVLEKCDDGWFVGTSQRSGCFGTFPGNYVERV